ncbi:ATP-binding protein [Allostreptomyces psammosilenae]|uniref:Anti-sigma regulatory factor (Ser/Thr protein kinase) n=1 Tax=Allostreptomyces psammosilenae TaxID=1892865 RepID=A0A852ZMD0_9ACTN|nr:ATP-binding protein [Allostreptomyces psammosilenae]NYI03563.1 anti-sigma regulatory factor (Ser/Thr protein kinase) [Allostreptomyces psammosilenae]
MHLHPSRVPIVRIALRAYLDQWSIPTPRAEDIETVFTELVTNCLRHAAKERRQASILLRLRPDHVHLSVGDGCPDPPIPTPDPCPDLLSESGRGLAIIEALSDAWGWAPRWPSGKLVWARFDLPHQR